MLTHVSMTQSSASCPTLFQDISKNAKLALLTFIWTNVAIFTPLIEASLSGYEITTVSVTSGAHLAQRLHRHLHLDLQERLNRTGNCN